MRSFSFRFYFIFIFIFIFIFRFNKTRAKFEKNTAMNVRESHNNECSAIRVRSLEQFGSTSIHSVFRFPLPFLFFRNLSRLLIVKYFIASNFEGNNPDTADIYISYATKADKLSLWEAGSFVSLKTDKNKEFILMLIDSRDQAVLASQGAEEAVELPSPLRDLDLVVVDDKERKMMKPDEFKAFKMKVMSKYPPGSSKKIDINKLEKKLDDNKSVSPRRSSRTPKSVQFFLYLFYLGYR